MTQIETATYFAFVGQWVGVLAMLVLLWVTLRRRAKEQRDKTARRVH